MRGKLEAEASQSPAAKILAAHVILVDQLNQALDHSAGDNREYAMTKTMKNASIFFGSRGVHARYYKEGVMQADMNLAC